MNADIVDIIIFALVIFQMTLLVGFYVCVHHEESEWRKAVEKRRKEAVRRWK